MAASVLIEKQKENKVNILLMKPKRRPESPFLRVHVRVCVTLANFIHIEVKMIRGFVGRDVETHPAGVCPLEGDVSPKLAGGGRRS